MTRSRSYFPVDPPHLAAIDGNRLRTYLLSQLQYPYLENGLILSYRYNDFDMVAGRPRPNSSTSLVNLLVKALTNGVAITLLTRDPYTDAAPLSGAPLKAWYQGLRRLDQAGAIVKLHPSLHAKVYLFQSQGSLFFFAAGSSNLTYQGMGAVWTECNIRGYHPADFAELQRRSMAILNDTKAETLAQWESRMRRSPKGLGLFI